MISSSYLLGIVGAILGVNFKVFTLRKQKADGQKCWFPLRSWRCCEEDCCTHLIYKAPSNGHRVILTHVQRL